MLNENCGLELILFCSPVMFSVMTFFSFVHSYIHWAVHVFVSLFTRLLDLETSLRPEVWKGRYQAEM